ncbi:MAG: hypothetical protein IKU19_08180, partial [Clostridia bacterium]|nr:hypothetical protein [Clostridia bacterium]
MYCAPSVPFSRDISRGGEEVCIPFIGSLSGLHFSSVGLIARISQTKQGAGRCTCLKCGIRNAECGIKVDFCPLKDKIILNFLPITYYFLPQ